MHFFSPAHIMKLVEIVVSSTSSPETIALVQFITSKRLGKVGVTVGNCPGFVGNRMIHPYSSEAVFILEEGGATVPEVDMALYKFGIAMGPLSMGDLAGNDIGYLIAKSKGLTRDPKTGKPGPNRKPGMRYSDLADDLVVKLGRVGMKAQKGWYDYDPKVGKGRTPIPSKEVEAFISDYVKHPRGKYTQQEIVERCLFGLVNEGFKILEENIAQKPSDIDVIYIYGYGWPAYKGGPMYWIDHEVGLAYFLKRLEQLHRAFPGTSYYEPSKLLKDCVALGITLEEYYKRQSSNKSKL
jgi:3-hydroxyacyl-CoA dehydrogenase